MTTFGEVSYNDDVYAGDKKNTNSKDLFLRLDPGPNEVRLVTAPFQYLVHKVKKDPTNPKDFGQKVSCSAIYGSCIICEAGDAAKPRWFYGVISRKTGTYKILDVSFAVFSTIRKLARNVKLGDPTKYDLNIEVDKNGGATGYYSVQALPKEPLSAADQHIKDNDVDLDDLKRRCTPLTTELLQARLDKIYGTVGAVPLVAPSTKKTATKAAPKATVKAATVSMTDDEELEETFPAYAETQS